MRTRFMLLLLTGALPVVAQQALVRPATLPVRHRLAIGFCNSLGMSAPAELSPGSLLGSGDLAADGLPAPVPTVRAAAYAALPTHPAPAVATVELPPVAPHGLIIAAAPPYDLYQNLPEEFRRHTLRAPWAEPLPLQLLRGALGR